MKLAVPADFLLPDLGEGYVTAGSAPAPAETVYWDSADMRLRRCGLVLRHGSGPQGSGPQGAGPQGAGPQGAAPTWTLELGPLANESSVVVGPDGEVGLQFLGGAAIVPRKVQGLLRGVLGSERLRPVGKLSTGSWRVGLVGAANEDAASAQVVVEHTTAEPFGDGSAVFGEVVVRPASSPSDALVEHVVSVLQGAGATTARSAELVEMLLGPACTKPHRSLLKRHATADTLVRDVFARGVDGLCREDLLVRLGDETALRRLSRLALRLRAELLAIAELVDEGRLSQLCRDLGWLGDRAGAVGDNDALAVSIEEAVVRLGPPEPGGPAGPGGPGGPGELRDALAARRRADRAELADVLNSARYVDLLDGLRRYSTDPPIAAGARVSEAASKAARRGAGRAWRAAATTVSSLGGAASDADLLKVRQDATAARYAAELAARAGSTNVARLGKRLRRVEKRLDAFSSSVSSCEWLTEAALSGRLSTEAAFTAGRVAQDELHRKRQAYLTWSDDWSRADGAQPASWKR